VLLLEGIVLIAWRGTTALPKFLYELVSGLGTVKCQKVVALLVGHDPPHILIQAPRVLSAEL